MTFSEEIQQLDSLCNVVKNYLRDKRKWPAKYLINWNLNISDETIDFDNGTLGDNFEAIPITFFDSGLEGIVSALDNLFAMRDEDARLRREKWIQEKEEKEKLADKFVKMSPKEYEVYMEWFHSTKVL